MNNTSTDKPTYILLKDIEQPNDHCLKAGTEFIKYSNSPEAAYVDTNRKRAFSSSTVENNPTWFQLQQPKEEELKSGDATYLDGFQMGVYWCKKYGIPKDLPENKQEVADWEIKSYEFDNRIYIPNEEPYITLSENFKSQKYTIHSVLRKSDNETFTVGEDTPDGRIVSFEIDKGGYCMKVNLEGNKYLWFHTVEKLTQTTSNASINCQNQEKDGGVFVTQDEVPLPFDYKGDLWRVFTKGTSYEMWRPFNFGMPQYVGDGEKYFYAQKKAEQYILENKPCISAKEVYLITAKYGLHAVPIEQEIEKLVNQKIKLSKD